MKIHPSSADSRSSSDANVQATLSSQLNWINWPGESDANAVTVVEYLLYSDAHVTGQFTDGLGPYSFLNTVPFPSSPGVVNAPIILRAAIRLPRHLPDMSKTDESLYHGGTFVDELAALTSVALGVRIRAGDQSRRFEPGQDPFGQPCEWRDKPIPSVGVQHNHLILPSVVGTQPMSKLEILKSIPRIKPARYVNLIRACQSYQDALWISESEPNLAWLMFVSALEMAANDVYETEASPDERLRVSEPDLTKLLKKHGGDELIHQVAKLIAHKLGATRKFIDFTIRFMPDEPAQRPEHDSLQVKWSDSGLKKVLHKVYGYRSRSLHGGIPFPAPMLRSLFYDSSDSPASEVPRIGLATYSRGGTWMPKDIPINLHCFHYITRGALLNWWKDISDGKNQSE